MLAGLVDIDTLDVGVSHRAAGEGGVEHAGQLHIVDVVAVAGEDARVLRAQDAGADIALGRDRVGHLLTPAADSTPSMIVSYPVQRQRLPESVSRTSASVGFGFSCSKAVICMTKPGVQNPHWKAWLSRRASCNGFMAPSGASSSMVVMVAPPACTASIKHERTGSPSMRTVQAPHTPCSHPKWVPVRP